MGSRACAGCRSTVARDHGSGSRRSDSRGAPWFAIGYIATVWRDGAPRLHPFCPIRDLVVADRLEHDAGGNDREGDPHQQSQRPPAKHRHHDEQEHELRALSPAARRCSDQWPCGSGASSPVRAATIGGTATTIHSHFEHRRSITATPYLRCIPGSSSWSGETPPKTPELDLSDLPPSPWATSLPPLEIPGRSLHFYRQILGLDGQVRQAQYGFIIITSAGVASTLFRGEPPSATGDFHIGVSLASATPVREGTGTVPIAPGDRARLV